MSSTSTWGSGSMTQDSGTPQDLFGLSPYSPGQGFEEAMLANGSIFGRVIPCPSGTAPNIIRPQESNSQGPTWYNRVLDASVQTSIPGANGVSAEATSGPVSSESTSGATHTSLRDPATLNFSRPHPFPQTVNANTQTRPQPAETNMLNNAQTVPSGMYWPTPTQIPPNACPVAARAYPYTVGRPSDMGSFAPQLPTQPLGPIPFSQTRVSGHSFASIQPDSTAAVMQTQLGADSFFGISPPASSHGYSGSNPYHRSGSSLGTDFTFPATPRSAYDDAHSNSLPPFGSPRGSSFRSRRSRRTHAHSQRFDASSVSSSNHVSRHAMPKGLDDPLDKRPEPKEAAEMTVSLECKVCMSQPVDTAVFPCGHAMFCRWCADKCMPSSRHDRSRVRESTRCPVCRCAVRQKMRIYLP